jgi:hypothetical protein
MSNTNKTNTHILTILRTLYNTKRAFSSLDFGDKMSNPNQYFCKLLPLGLIDERTITKGNKTFKIRFIPQDKRAKARNYICELEQKATTKKAVSKSGIETPRPTNGNVSKAGQSLKTLFDCLIDGTMQC